MCWVLPQVETKITLKNDTESNRTNGGRNDKIGVLA